MGHGEGDGGIPVDPPSVLYELGSAGSVSQGDSLPDIHRLCRLAQILQLSTDALLGVTPAGEGALIGADVGGTKSEFVRITNASLIESHPHDISISKEAPNYTQH